MSYTTTASIFFGTKVAEFIDSEDLPDSLECIEAGDYRGGGLDYFVAAKSTIQNFEDYSLCLEDFERPRGKIIEDLLKFGKTVPQWWLVSLTS